MVAYAETVDDFSTSDAGFTLQGGRAKLVQQVADVDLTGMLTDVLGSVTANGDGRLARNLPKAHPRWTWLYAAAVNGIQGYGAYFIQGSSPVADNPNILSAYAAYPDSNVTIEFTPRPYAVLPDSAITMNVGAYTDPTNTVQTYKWANEWLRFTDVEIIPDGATVTAQRGQMKFRTQSGNAPNNFTFVGSPKLPLNVANCIIRVSNVPYNYIISSNSYLNKYRGTVNQNGLLMFSPGQLLYINYRATRYTPPVPAIVTEPGSSSVFSTDKNCDLELICQYTTRSQGDVITPVNGNWIANGHNCLPWLSGSAASKFYYATTVSNTAPSQADNNPALWVPQWLSAPHELLLTDPDWGLANQPNV